MSARLDVAMPTYDESLAITTELIRRHVEGDRAIRPADHIMNDLGLDSLNLMELVADIEGRFEIDIPTEMFDHLATVDDVAKAIIVLKSTGA